MPGKRLPTWKALAEGCEFERLDWQWLAQQSRVAGFAPNRYGHLVQAAVDKMAGGMNNLPGITVLRFGVGVPSPYGHQANWATLSRAALKSKRDLQILIRRVWQKGTLGIAGKLDFGRPKTLTDLEVGSYDILFRDHGPEAVVAVMGPVFGLLREEVLRYWGERARQDVRELLAMGVQYAELDELLRGELVRTVHVV